MAISVQDANKLSDYEKKLADKLEKKIDKYLEDHFDGSPISINIHSLEYTYRCNSALPGRVVNEIVQRYKSAGWGEIFYFHTPGGWGDRCELKFNP